jgi:predicted transcriptional regulator of viral defense system
LSRFPVFSLSDVRGIDPSFDRRRLSEWQQKGYIRKIIKGFYFFTDLDLDEPKLLHIANKIYRPSYISFETALSRYHLIPESVYAVTSASTRRTMEFDTPISRFSYRTIHKRLYFGYRIESGPMRIAFMEKALLDHLYLNSTLRTEEDFSALRINREALLDQLDEERLHHYIARFAVKALESRIRRFLERMIHA